MRARSSGFALVARRCWSLLGCAMPALVCVGLAACGSAALPAAPPGANPGANPGAPPAAPPATADVLVPKALAQSLAIDGNHLYWTSQEGTVMKSGLLGEEPTTLVPASSNPSHPWALAVDATSVYFITETGDVRKASLDGSELLTVDSNAANWAADIAVDANGIYWSRTDGSIMTAALDGSGVHAIISGEDKPETIAADDGHLYWSTRGEIRKASSSGQGVTTLASGQCGVDELAIDSSNVYWTTQCGTHGTVMKVSKDGKALTTIADGLPRGQDGPYSVRPDESGIYWSVGTGSIMRSPSSGGSAITVAASQDYPDRVIVGPSKIYWIDQGSRSDGGILSVDK